MCNDFLEGPAASSVDVRFSRFPLTSPRITGSRMVAVENTFDLDL
jgi:hypothetical protein